MNAQLDRDAEGTEPSPEQERWWDVSYRRFGWTAGLPLLAGGLLGLHLEIGSGRLGPSLFFVGLLLSGLLDSLSWLLEMIEWRRGGKLTIGRRWPLLFRFTAVSLILFGGLAWLLGI
jgi:hypothetical protein